MPHQRLFHNHALIAGAAGQDLEPEVGHFIGGLISGRTRCGGWFGFSGFAAELS